MRKFPEFTKFFFQGEQKLINIPGCEVIVVISNNPESNSENSLQERMMNQWQNLVWFSHVPNSSLLLADSFHTHTNSFIQKSMVNRGACLAIIPSACSQKLQPLHRGIKLKFKVLQAYNFCGKCILHLLFRNMLNVCT